MVYILRPAWNTLLQSFFISILLQTQERADSLGDLVRKLTFVSYPALKKRKDSSCTQWSCMEEWMYSSTHSVGNEVHGRGQLHVPVDLPTTSWIWSCVGSGVGLDILKKKWISFPWREYKRISPVIRPPPPPNPQPPTPFAPTRNTIQSLNVYYSFRLRHSVVFRWISALVWIRKPTRCHILYSLFLF